MFLFIQFAFNFVPLVQLGAVDHFAIPIEPQKDWNNTSSYQALRLNKVDIGAAM